jgi:transposase
MIAFPSGARVWLTTGHTDMRKGFGSLALMVQEAFGRDPHAGDLWVFRGRRGDLIKLIWHDGDGACLFVKRLERGRFLWPSVADGVVPRSSPICCLAFTGECRRKPGVPRRPDDCGGLTQGAVSQTTFAAESVLVIVVTSPREHPADGLPDVLPGDLTSAHTMILAQREMLVAAQSEAKVRALEIERLKLQLARARRQTYGQSSERGKLLVEQLELAIEELEETQAEEEAKAETAEPEPARTQRRRPKRGPRRLPENLPVERVVEPAPCVCGKCGGARLRKLGEVVSKTLECEPRRWKIIERVREKFSCRDWTGGLLRSLARVKLLILDDWGPEALTPDQARDLLEIVEDRRAHVRLDDALRAIRRAHRLFRSHDTRRSRKPPAQANSSRIGVFKRTLIGRTGFG